MNSITVPDGATIKLTRTGIVWNGQPNLQEWLDAFGALWEAQEAMRWCLGDMIIYAETQITWGEMYAQALDETPFAYSTLTQYVRVCRAFPYERRRADVSWTHYQRLAAVPEAIQETLLDQIEAGAIATTAETAEIVKQERAAGSVRDDEPEPIPAEAEYPPCPLCGWPLEMYRGRCNNCQATVNEMAYRYRDLFRAACGFFDTGDVGTLQAVVSAYRNQEDE